MKIAAQVQDVILLTYDVQIKNIFLYHEKKIFFQRTLNIYNKFYKTSIYYFLQVLV